jgi:hypothetical protein
MKIYNGVFLLKNLKVIQIISLGGLLTAFTVLLQAAPVFLPAFGLAISPLNTLPIALASILNYILGITVLFSSVFILLLLSPQEAIILLCTTGLLGVVLGVLIYRKGKLISILASAVALSIGMIFLTYIAAIPSFVELTVTLNFPVVIVLYFLFSLSYVSIWSLCCRKFVKRLVKIKLIEEPGRNNEYRR